MSISLTEMGSNCRVLHSAEPKFVLDFQLIRTVCLMIHREARPVQTCTYLLLRCCFCGVVAQMLGTQCENSCEIM